MDPPSDLLLSPCSYPYSCKLTFIFLQQDSSSLRVAVPSGLLSCHSGHKDRLSPSPRSLGRNIGHHSSSMETVSQRLCLSWCRTPWATIDSASGGRGEQESGLREALLGFWVAPEHLDCGSLRALLWSPCSTQVFMPRADTSLFSQVLLLSVVPQRCKALTAASPHCQQKTLLVPTSLTLLHVVCFMGYHEAGEDLQHSAFCVV